MNTERFSIVVRQANGESFEAFIWVRDPESGIDRAKRDCSQFGIEYAEITAERI